MRRSRPDPRSPVRALACIGALALCLAAAPAAGAAPTPEPSSEILLLREYENWLVGAVLDFGFGASAVGDALLGDLGAEYVGVRTFGGRRWLVTWDAFLGARGGLLGNTHPYTPLAGMRLRGAASGGYRFLRHGRWAPYAGGRLDLALDVLTRPGTALGDLDQLNDMSGVGGVAASGDVRAEFGGSFLDGPHSVLLVGFFREFLRAPTIWTGGAAFSEGGVGLRYDYQRQVMLELDVAAGATPASTDAALATTVQTTRAGVSVVARKIFGNGLWLALEGGLSREFDKRTYANSPQVYETAAAPAMHVSLLLGVSLDRARWRKGGAR